MSAKETKQRSIKKVLFENFQLKVISLLCALAFYGLIHGASNAQRTIDVSIVSVMPSESANRQLIVPLPTRVSVTLRGSKALLDELRSDDVGNIQLDLSSGRQTRVELTSMMVHVPAGLKVEQIIPEYLDLKWDDVITRPIAVQIPKTGEPVSGLSVRTITVEPAVVNARGPKSQVDVLQFVRTVPFDLTGISEGEHRRALSLEKPPERVGFDVESVIALARVERELVKKQFSKLKVEIVGLPRGNVSPGNISVVVIGTSDAVNAVTADSIVPRVEPKNSGADTSKPGGAYLDVLVDVPNVRVETIPNKVLVKW